MDMSNRSETAGQKRCLGLLLFTALSPFRSFPRSEEADRACERWLRVGGVGADGGVEEQFAAHSED